MFDCDSLKKEKKKKKKKKRYLPLQFKMRGLQTMYMPVQ